MTKPQVLEVTVNFSGGGKVQIVDYGRINSDYHASITRKYSIPPDWSEAEVEVFELEKISELHDQLEPVLQQEFDERYKQRNWD